MPAEGRFHACKDSISEGSRWLRAEARTREVADSAMRRSSLALRGSLVGAGRRARPHGPMRVRDVPLARAARSVGSRGRPLRHARRCTGAAGSVGSGRGRPAGRWRPWRRRRTSGPGGRVGARLARRQPVLDGPLRPRRSAARPAASRACARTTSRARSTRVPPRRVAIAGSPAIIPRRGWNADETIRARAAAVRARAVASPSSTTRPARTPTRREAVRRDRARDRALPRQGERLERHRLQLSRRPVRPGLRGPRTAGSTRNVVGAHAGGSTPARSASR